MKRPERAVGKTENYSVTFTLTDMHITALDQYFPAYWVEYKDRDGSCKALMYRRDRCWLNYGGNFPTDIYLNTALMNFWYKASQSCYDVKEPCEPGMRRPSRTQGFTEEYSLSFSYAHEHGRDVSVWVTYRDACGASTAHLRRIAAGVWHNAATTTSIAGFPLDIFVNDELIEYWWRKSSSSSKLQNKALDPERPTREGGSEDYELSFEDSGRVWKDEYSSHALKVWLVTYQDKTGTLIRVPLVYDRHVWFYEGDEAPLPHDLYTDDAILSYWFDLKMPGRSHFA